MDELEGSGEDALYLGTLGKPPMLSKLTMLEGGPPDAHAR
jgi:hypothetical protein